MRAHRAATANTLTSSHLESICLEMCVYKTLFYLQRNRFLNNSCRSNAMPAWMRWQWAETSPLCYCGNRHDLWPPTSTLKLSAFDCVCGSVGRPITNTHLGQWWTVMDGNLWAMRSAESAPCRVNQLTSARCVYLDSVIHSVVPDIEMCFVWGGWKERWKN